MNDRKLLAFPNHTADPISVGEMPSHSHDFIPDTLENGTTGGHSWFLDSGTKGDTNGVVRTTEKTGGDNYHNNLQPSYGVFRFKRIS